MKKLLVLAFASVLLAGTAILCVPQPAMATPITVDYAYHYRDNRSDNSINIFAGDRLQFGAGSVQPDGTETTGTATTGGQPVPPISLLYHPYSIAPHVYETSVPYAAGRTGHWDLKFTNGSDTTTAQTPAVGVATPIVGLARNIAVSGSSLTPTFTWTMPEGFSPDGVSLRIWDLQRRIGQAGLGPLADVIYVERNLGTKTSFTVPTGLEQGHAYSFEISPAILRTPGAFQGSWNVLSQSRLFIDFTPMPEGAPDNVFLPIVTPGPSIVYSFDVDVTAGQQIFIDPMVAIGYDYAIGQGDPQFASVTLPTGIGDNKYSLYTWNGSEFVFSQTLDGGVAFDFGTGVDRFRVLGIETSAGLDPADSTAFITGLTFEGDGAFTGTMTPITTNVPEPHAVILLLTGLAGVGFIRRKSKG